MRSETVVKGILIAILRKSTCGASRTSPCCAMVHFPVDMHQLNSATLTPLWHKETTTCIPTGQIHSLRCLQYKRYIDCNSEKMWSKSGPALCYADTFQLTCISFYLLLWRCRGTKKPQSASPIVSPPKLPALRHCNTKYATCSYACNKNAIYKHANTFQLICSFSLLL